MHSQMNVLEYFIGSINFPIDVVKILEKLEQLNTIDEHRIKEFGTIKSMLSNNQFDTALKELDETHEPSFKNANEHIIRSLIYHSKGQYEMACHHLVIANLAKPDAAWILYLHSIMLVKTGRGSESCEVFNKIMNTEIFSDELSETVSISRVDVETMLNQDLFNFGWCIAIALCGDYEYALNILEEDKVIYPCQLARDLTILILNLLDHDYSSFNRWFVRFEPTYQTNYYFNVIRVLYLENIGQHSAAFKSLEFIINGAIKDPYVNELFAVWLSKAGEYARSRDIFLSILTYPSVPNRFTVTLSIAQLSLMMKDMVSTLRYSYEAYLLNPDDFKTNELRGYILYACYLDEEVKYRNNSINAGAYLCNMQKLKNSFISRIMFHFKKAVESKECESITNYNYAIFLDHISCYSPAIEQFELALAYDTQPEDTLEKYRTCCMKYAKLMVRKRKYDDAISIYNKLLKHFPKSVEILTLCGWTHYLNENIEYARSLLTRSMHIDFYSGYARIHSLVLDYHILGAENFDDNVLLTKILEALCNLSVFEVDELMKAYRFFIEECVLRLQNEFECNPIYNTPQIKYNKMAINNVSNNHHIKVVGGNGLIISKETEDSDETEWFNAALEDQKSKCIKSSIVVSLSNDTNQNTNNNHNHSNNNNNSIQNSLISVQPENNSTFDKKNGNTDKIIKINDNTLDDTNVASVKSQSISNMGVNHSKTTTEKKNDNVSESISYQVTNQISLDNTKQTNIVGNTQVVDNKLIKSPDTTNYISDSVSQSDTSSFDHEYFLQRELNALLKILNGIKELKDNTF